MHPAPQHFNVAESQYRRDNFDSGWRQFSDSRGHGALGRPSDYPRVDPGISEGARADPHAHARLNPIVSQVREITNREDIAESHERQATEPKLPACFANAASAFWNS